MPLLETITLITTSIISILNAISHIHIYRKRKPKHGVKFRRHSV